MESIFAVLWMTAVHVLLSGAHITLHLATLGSWAKSNGVSFQFSPVMVNFWVLTLWPPTMLRVIVSSEVPYLSGHLRAFAAIWLLGTIICLPLVMVLMEIAWDFAWTSCDGISQPGKMLCFKSVYPSSWRDKKCRELMLFRLIISFTALGAGCAMSWRFCSACGIGRRVLSWFIVSFPSRFRGRFGSGWGGF